jgi:hypothetical protein
LSGPLVLVGGPGADEAMRSFAQAGLAARRVGTAADLLAADASGIRYTLVHVGPDDGEADGTFARAHHRIAAADIRELATRLRPRERPLVRVLAFAYKNGLPADATWLVDVRFLANPYWIAELRHLDGRDPAVRDYVLGQPAAVELLDRVEDLLRWCIPRYQRPELTVAFGCTGGRHRSVVLGGEMAARLSGFQGADVEFRARDL